MRRLSFLLGLFSLSFAICAHPLSVSARVKSPRAELSPAQLDERLHELASSFKTAQTTWIVRDLRRESSYSEERADQLMHPASTNKLATTAVALDTLGARFRYTTRLWGSAPPAQGPITLYWEASGDSKITREVYRAWVKELKAKGVTAVAGLVIDDQRFTTQALAPGYESAPDDDAAYRAAAGGVGFDFNRLVIRARPGELNGPPKIKLVPPIKSVTIQNDAITTSKGREELKIKLRERPDEQLLIVVSGSIPKRSRGKPFKGISVARRAPFPLRFAGEALLSAIQKGGIKLSRGASVTRGTLPPIAERTALIEHRSPQLKSLLHDINTYSNNFMAEQTLLTLGLEERGFGGWDEGLSFVRERLKQRFKLSGFQYVNGSGLFGAAAFSARQLTGLLTRANKLSRGGFAELLPRSRREGTIKRRFKKLPKGAVRAKTGTLNGVSTLCGYLTTRAKQKLSFCVMMGGFPKERLKVARALQDEMVTEMWRLKNPHPKPKASSKRSSKRRAQSKSAASPASGLRSPRSR